MERDMTVHLSKSVNAPPTEIKLYGELLSIHEPR
jgi:hypothetical protein